MCLGLVLWVFASFFSIQCLMLDFVPASFSAFFKSFSVRVVFFLRLTSIMLYILPEIYLLMFSLHMLSPPVTI